MASSTRSRCWSKTTKADFSLNETEAELVAREASAFARALPDPAARARYEQLAASAAAGDVPAELLAPLETMLEMLFESGRVSNRAMLQAVFARTPRGRAQSAALHDVNRALETLQGQTIVALRVTSTGPAARSVSIETESARLSIEFTRAGASVTSLEVG